MSAPQPQNAAPSPDTTVLFCPSCGRRYALAPSVLVGPHLLLLCGACETPFSPEQGAASARPGSLPAPRVQTGRPTVLVAHDSPAVCATLGRVLEEAGYVPRYVHDGARAIAAFDASLPDHPVALVLDVGIPEVLAFQVCTILKARPDAAGVPVILLASVFERTRYKRRPTSLHGADAYLELHHVPDRLGELLHGLLDKQQVSDIRGHLPVERARADALKPAGEGAPAPDPDSARALARRLVSDVALYHEAGLVRGLKAGDALQEQEVRNAMAEARGMFQRQAGKADGSSDAVFEDAVAALVAGLRRSHT